MDSAMPAPHTPPHARRTRRFACALLGAVALVALAGPIATQALAAGAGSTATTPTFPVPATAKPQATAGTTVPTTSTATAAAAGAVAAPAAGSTTTTATPPASATQTGTTPAGAAQTTTAPAGNATGTAAPTTTRVVVVHTQAHSTSNLSDTAIAAATLAALIALGCLIWGVARILAYEPRWTLSLRHAMAEAGFRASATWAEFTDWARLGR